jgi:hypothetical protein
MPESNHDLLSCGVRHKVYSDRLFHGIVRIIYSQILNRIHIPANDNLLLIELR